MLIPVIIIAAFYIGLLYGLFQDIQKAIKQKQERQLARDDSELKQLDFNERLQSMENETVWILNELENETDRTQVIKLNKELQRVQKQRYITKYKE